MIKASELRIGNWINEQGLELQVGKIDCELFKGSEAIPLTEEWFLKFGFTKWKDRLTIEAWAKDHPSQRFDIDFKAGDIIMNSRYQEHHDSFVMGHIKYVHQLQNLYFALTGEELTIK